jgi:hypothetical protein
MKIKKFNELNEGFYGEDEGIIEGYLHSLFVDYFILESNEYDYPYNIYGYTTEIINDEDPGDDYDYENSPAKYKTYMVKKLGVDIFEIKLNYTEGTLGIGKIIHRNHYIELIRNNWNILNEFMYEKMKNDIL